MSAIDTTVYFVCIFSLQLYGKEQNFYIRNSYPYTVHKRMLTADERFHESIFIADIVLFFAKKSGNNSAGMNAHGCVR